MKEKKDIHVDIVAVMTVAQAKSIETFLKSRGIHPRVFEVSDLSEVITDADLNAGD